MSVEALAGREAEAGACGRGCDYLVARVRDGGLDRPAPIGLYFAGLWYAESLYPTIWTVSALGRVLSASGRQVPVTSGV